MDMEQRLRARRRAAATNREPEHACLKRRVWRVDPITAIDRARWVSGEYRIRLEEPAGMLYPWD